MAEFRYVKNDTKRTAETAVIITTRTEMNTMMNTMIPLTIANTLNQTNKQRIEAKASQSLKAVIQEQKLAPAGQFDVYDQSGKVISNDNAAQHRDSTVYVGVAKVAGGSILMKDFSKISRGFPSIRHIKQYSSEQSVGAFVVNLPGIVSHHDSTEMSYTVLVDGRNFPELPSAYVLSPSCNQIEHSNIYEGKVFSIAPNKKMCAICTGGSFTDEWYSRIQESGLTPPMMLGMFLDHLIQVLKNPNPDDPAREV